MSTLLVKIYVLIGEQSLKILFDEQTYSLIKGR